MEEGKKKIISLFNKKVKNKVIDISGYNKKHCGKEGYWLEKQFGIQSNCKNEPDIYGYEMKKGSSKITFGDFQATEYLFSKRKQILLKQNQISNLDISRNKFIEYFGEPNEKKNNRYSWSGKSFPILNEWNGCGQKIIVDENDNILILYSYDNDKRTRKLLFPNFLKNKELIIAIWLSDNLRKKINNKFNKTGFFICKKNKDFFHSICFGNPFDFNFFIKSFQEKKIFIDSGMYVGNNRSYSQFRASSSFWNNLIIEEY